MDVRVRLVAVARARVHDKTALPARERAPECPGFNVARSEYPASVDVYDEDVVIVDDGGDAPVLDCVAPGVDIPAEPLR